MYSAVPKKSFKHLCLIVSLVGYHLPRACVASLELYKIGVRNLYISSRLVGKSLLESSSDLFSRPGRCKQAFTSLCVENVFEVID
jgi:hypothetical protein